MRFAARLALPLALVVPCLALACTEKQESAPQQQPASTPTEQAPQATTAARPKIPIGIPIKRPFQGVGDNTPTPSPSPSPAVQNPAPGGSTSASK